jgi:hypothetical protein
LMNTSFYGPSWTFMLFSIFMDLHVVFDLYGPSCCFPYRDFKHFLKITRIYRSK